MSREFTQCSLCKLQFVEPKLLPSCFHTFCLKCLEKYGSGRTDCSQFPCPECGVPFNVPEKGFAALMTNLFVQRLIRIQTVSEPPRSAGPPCDLCAADGKDFNAKAVCVQCLDLLCERCSSEHRRPRPCRDHEVVQFGDLGKTELESKFSSDGCENHPGYRLDRWCRTCDRFICEVCYAYIHVTHECPQLDAVKDLRLRAIRGEIGSMDGFLDGYSLKKAQLEKTEVEFSESITEIEDEIRSRCQELKDLIDRSARELLANAESVRDDGLNQLNTKRDELKDVAGKVEDFRAYCSHLCDKGSSRDICSSESLIRERVRALREQHDAQLSHRLTLPAITMQKSNLDALYNSTTDSKNIVGNIKVYNPPQMTFMKTIDFQGYSVVGLATLNQRFYVLCRSPQTVLDELIPPNVIKVFSNQTPFAFLKDIVLGCFTSSFDLAACQTEGCLYATDIRLVYIIRYECTSGEYRTSKFLGWENSPHTISVTGEGHILLPRDGSPCCLEVYSSNKTLISRTELLPRIASVIHAVRSSTNSILALVRWRDSDASTSIAPGSVGNSKSLCEISPRGDILKSFRPLKRSQELDDPQYLALYKSHVFVADHGRDCVPLVDSELRLLWFNRLHCLCGPKRILYDDANNFLFVGHFKNTGKENLEGKVDIYKII